MRATLSQWSIPMLAGLLLVTMPGCSKKSVQSGGDTQSSQSGMGKGAPGAGGTGGSGDSTGGGVWASVADASATAGETLVLHIGNRRTVIRPQGGGRVQGVFVPSENGGQNSGQRRP